MKLRIKAVLFDLDDTLWPIGPVIQRAEQVLHDWIGEHAPAVVQRYTIEQLREQRMAWIEKHPPYKIDLRGLRHKVLSEAFTECGAEQALVEAAMEIFERERNTVTPFEDVLPALARLAEPGHAAQPLILGSISNGFADLEKIGLAHHFQLSIAAHRFGSAKPDPAIFLAACAELGIAPQEAVYIGDDLVLDVQGAQAAGLRAVWINRTGRPAQEVLLPGLEPDAVVTSLHELEQWLMQECNCS